MSTSEINFTHRDSNSRANRIRIDGEVPGILYGNNSENVLVKIPEKQLMQKVTSEGWHNLKNIDVDGEKYTAIIKEVQTDPLTRKIIHIDLETVQPTEIVTTEIPIRFVQNKNSAKAGEVLQKDKSSVKVKCPAKSVPEFLNVTINPQMASVYTIANIEAAEEISILDDPKTVLASLEWGGAKAENTEEDEQ